jgi:tRNA U34 5-methylaminomethyl-2-thiouridine-forming methyltransferase MnmC
MERHLIQTADGSHSFEINAGAETYHSRHGAVQESTHVFIASGLRAIESKQHIRVFEVGFGTGLNALLSWREATASQRKIEYTALEPFPLTTEEARLLNYANADEHDGFIRMHGEANGTIDVSAYFTLIRLAATYPAHPSEKEHYDIIYYDAFGPNTQPLLWTLECFEKAFDLLVRGGMLVTYCAKGQVRRDLQSAGFEVERLAGPPGKREMLRARKPL